MNVIWWKLKISKRGPHRLRPIALAAFEANKPKSSGGITSEPWLYGQTVHLLVRDGIIIEAFDDRRERRLYTRQVRQEMMILSITY